ncbi:hypothetical protein ACFW2Y_33500 [Streptomyces sp. NPDC058877]|uniref:hypothetical protein n=1 Tax=Streptomyces sp. NPDC058877 TaxID=3346665 RepID=UPI0036C9A700
MADERYQWLDQEAAERLLRGEPVEAVDDRARSQVELLAGALEAARTPAVQPTDTGELPGEAAALLAFRRAAAERAAAGAGAAAAGAAATPGRAPRTSGVDPVRRWGRSVRYGLAAALAAVTVGGVAVAAGTGVLPLGGPAPTTSATAGNTADPLVSKDSGIPRGTAVPTTEPGGDGSTPGASPSAGSGAPDPTAGTPDRKGADTEGAGSEGTDTPKPGVTTARPDAGSGGQGGTGAGGTSREKDLKACQEYREGRLDATDRQRLVDRLRSGETLRRYCDRILSGDTGTSQEPDRGDSGDPSDPRPGSGSGGSSGSGSTGAKDGDRGTSGAGNQNGGGRGDALLSTGTADAPSTASGTGTTVATRVPLAV